MAMNQALVIEAIAAQALFAELYRRYMEDWDPTGSLLLWHSPRICLGRAGRDWYEIAFAAWLASLMADKFHGFAATIEGIKMEAEGIVKEPKFRYAIFRNWFRQNVLPADDVAYNSEIVITVPEAVLAARLLLPRLKEDDPEAVVQEMEWTFWGFLAVQSGASWVPPTRENIAEIKRALANIVFGTLHELACSNASTRPFELLKTLVGEEKRNDLLVKTQQFGREGMVWLYEYLKEADPGLAESDLDQQVEGSAYDFTGRRWMPILLNGMGLAYSVRYISALPENFVRATQRRLLAWLRGMKLDALYP
jgi:hypothetical protein